MKITQLTLAAVVVCEALILIALLVSLRNRPAQPQPPQWTEVMHQAGGYVVECPAGSRVDLDEHQLLCQGPYGRRASVRAGETSITSAQAFVAQASAQGFVGAETSVIGTRDVTRINAVVTTEHGVEGRQMTVVRDGRWYRLECDFSDVDIERFFASFRFADTLQ